MTTSDYTKRIDHYYVKTYSFQRGGEYDAIENYYEKVRSEVTISQQEKEAFRRLRNIEEKLYLTKIFDKNNELEKSAVLVCEFDKESTNYFKLLTILTTDFEEEKLWMCAPIYRDAILFFDQNNKLVGGLNICFECERIESINNEHITTDYKVFQLLKEFLMNKGHQIN